MTCGTDAKATQLSTAYWYLDMGDVQPNELSAENLTAKTNRGFIILWNRLRTRREVQLFGRLHSDIYIVPPYLLPDVRLQIRLTKAQPKFYLVNNSFNLKTVLWTPNYLSDTSGETPQYCWLTIWHLTRVVSRSINWRVSNSRHSHSRPDQNSWL